jgi:hypothetical protein
MTARLAVSAFFLTWMVAAILAASGALAHAAGPPVGPVTSSTGAATASGIHLRKLVSLRMPKTTTRGRR